MTAVRRMIILGLLLSAALCLEAQIQDWLWARRAGGGEVDFAEDVATDASGNCYLTGKFSSLASFGAINLNSSGATDIFVAKLDALGNWLWAVKAGGPGSDTGTGIAVDPDGNVYVTGYFSGTISFGPFNDTSVGGTDYFIAKLNTNGGWLWAQGDGSPANDYSWDITLDAARNAYFTGQFNEDNVMVIKYNSSGAYQSEWIAAESSAGCGLGIVSDPSGNLTLTGYFSGQLAFGPHVLNTNGAKDIFVARMSSAVAWTWAGHAGGPEDDYGTAVALDGWGDAYITGYFQGTADFFSATNLTSRGLQDIFVLKLYSTGGMNWVIQAGGAGTDAGLDICADSEGRSYVTGAIGGTAIFGDIAIGFGGELDIFAAAISEYAEWRGVVHAGGTDTDTGRGIALDSSGNLCLTGYFSTAVIFGDHAQTSGGSFDIFITKLGPDTPRAPENLTLYQDGITALLTWNPVTESIYGHALSPDYYFVYRSYDLAPGSFEYLGMSLNTVFYHDYVMLGEPFSFYRVTAVKTYNRSDTAEESAAKARYLRQNLRPGMSEAEVEAVLRSLMNFRL